MKKVRLLLSLLLVITTLFALVGCSSPEQATAYGQKWLSNQDDYAIDTIWVPISFWSSGSLDGTETDSQYISTFIGKLASLEFASSKYVFNKTVDKIKHGKYGVDIEIGNLLYVTEYEMGTKFVVSIHYKNGVSAYVLVDYDGTVYYVNDKDNQLLSTQPNTFYTKDCF